MEPIPTPQGGQEPPAPKANGAEPTPAPELQAGKEPTPTPKTYTEDEFKTESEKLIAEALKTANAKSEEAFKQQLQDARAEWEKEAKMTAAEREKAAQEKARAEFEKEKAEFAHERLVSHAATQLVKNGLPEKIAELITASNADGAYLLPEGVTFEMVDRIIDGAREIDKRDFRSYGIEYYYGRCGRFVLPVRNRVRGSIDVIYLKKHEPIRTIEVKNYETVLTGNTFRFPNTAGFESGDTVTITSENEKFENVPILGVGQVFIPIYDDDGSVVADYLRANVPDGTFTSALDGKSSISLVCSIKRCVTDETLCDAPYDRMYVDFVNAQICYYQRDFDTYNQHMNLFNQRMAAYQAWLQQRRTQDKDGKITNWW